MPLKKEILPVLMTDISYIFRNFIIYGLLGVLFVSCSSKAIIDEYQHIEGDVWKSGNVRRFKFKLDNIERPYSFYINIRHTTDYKYSNLFLFVESSFPDGTIARDTIELLLAAPDGRWLGKGLGKIKENIILLNPKILLPDTGQYEISLEQGMRETQLKGISDIGIKIDASDTAPEN